MILVVDDDASLLRTLRRVLQRAGYRVAAFADPREALEHVAGEEPELILCDIVMPDMNGFEFRKAYEARHPDRETTFAFLSGLGAVEDVVRGLETGVDDYFVKPIEPAVLIARVRTLLRRRRVGVSARFRGDLRQFSLVQIMQYCEKHKLSGHVKFETSNGTLAVEFNGGEMVLDDTDELLDEVMGLEEGTFVILSQPVGFDEIAIAAKLSTPPLPSDGPDDPGLLGAGVEGTSAPQLPESKAAATDEPPRAIAPAAGAEAAPTTTPATPAQEAQPVPTADTPPAVKAPTPQPLNSQPPMQAPMGRLSGVERGGRLFQLQTEYETLPVDEIVTIVTVDGRVMKKHTQPRPLGADGEQLRELLERQHRDVDRALVAKLDSANKQRQQTNSVSDADEERPFDRGLQRWREGDLAGALRLLERAQLLSPNDRALAACVAAVRRRAAKTG